MAHSWWVGELLLHGFPAHGRYHSPTFSADTTLAKPMKNSPLSVKINDHCWYIIYPSRLSLVHRHHPSITCRPVAPVVFHCGSKMSTTDSKLSRPTIHLKTPKGTRDWVGSELVLRDHILYVIINPSNSLQAEPC